MAIKEPAPPSSLSSLPLQDGSSVSCEHAPLIVLIAEDDQDIRDMEAHMVKSMGHTVNLATTGREALQRAQEQLPDIVLLDVMMPEMDGFDFCRAVRADDTLRDLHIIITSARDALDDKIKALGLGAADYLTKPFSLTELKARIQVGERIVRYRKALKNQQVLLEHMAREDTLTGLCNRRHFMERAQEEWLRARRYAHPLSVLISDIDYFKAINDRHGHAWGDTVLKEVGKTLLAHCRSSDLVARYGGEEFTVLLFETTIGSALEVAERLRLAVKALVFEHPSGPIHVTMSFGVASLQNDHPQSLTELIEEADQALYTAKHNGRDRVEKYRTGQQLMPAPSTATAKT